MGLLTRLTAIKESLKSVRNVLKNLDIQFKLIVVPCGIGSFLGHIIAAHVADVLLSLIITVA
jgi:hypothetical protein